MLYPNGTTECPTITSGFGPRAATGGASSYHRGADSIGYAILHAVEAGTVRCSGSAPAGWGAGGDQVWIQHDGFFSKSLHQARSLVSDGQWVNEGDPIGVMGETGSAQGVHQHLEITPGELHFGNYGQVDPIAFIAARLATAPAATPNTHTPNESEEDDMRIIYSQHLDREFLIGDGGITHLVGGASAAYNAIGVPGNRNTNQLGKNDFRMVVEGLGISYERTRLLKEGERLEKDLRYSVVEDGVAVLDAGNVEWGPDWA